MYVPAKTERSQPIRIRPTSNPTAAQSFCRPRMYTITQQSKASGTGDPPQIRDIGGRSQGDDEHVRERIVLGSPPRGGGAADRTRAGGDAGFSAHLGVPAASPYSVGCVGARPPRARR